MLSDALGQVSTAVIEDRHEKGGRLLENPEFLLDIAAIIRF